MRLKLHDSAYDQSLFVNRQVLSSRARSEKHQAIQKNKMQISFRAGELEKITLLHKGKYILFNKNDIIYCQAAGNYCTLYLKNKLTITQSKTLKTIESMLSSHYFLRCHQSYLVNMKYINHMSRCKKLGLCWDNQKIILPIARRRVDFIKKAMRN